jgi:Mg/Co/Ni transporter MgtE
VRQENAVVQYVCEVMIPEPPTIDATTSIEQVARQMRRWDVREAFVTDQGRLCGVLTDADLVVLAIASGHDPSTLPAGLACAPESPRVRSDQSTGDADACMRLHDRRSLPVVDQDDRVVGTVWIDDLAAADSRPMATSAPL